MTVATSSPNLSPSILLEQNSINDDKFQPLFKPYNVLDFSQVSEMNGDYVPFKSLNELKVHFDEANLKQKPSRCSRMNLLLKNKMEKNRVDSFLELSSASFVNELEENNAKPRGYDNLALMNLAISTNKLNKTLSYKKKLCKIAHQNKLNFGKFIDYPSNHDYFDIYARYWCKIKKTLEFQILKMESKDIAKNGGYVISNFEGTMARYSCMVLPNGLNILDFEYMQNKFDNWYYKTNPKQPLSKLPLRWCGQKANFFQPLVIRYQLCDSGRHVSKQGLCPYCPVFEEDKKTGYKFHFYKIDNKSYESHVSRHHGVYGSGNEMIPPYFTKDIDHSYAKLYYVCAECKHVLALDNESISITKKSFMEYFKHCSYCHYKREHVGVTDLQFKRIKEADFIY